MPKYTESDFQATVDRLTRVEQLVAGIIRRAGLRAGRLDDHRRVLNQRLHQISFPVLLAKDGTPILVDGGRAELPKFLVISVPRSGTHLASEVLSALGLVSGGLHLSADGTRGIAQDRRFFLPSPTGSDWMNYELSLADVIRLLQPGQFVQGHVPFSPDLVAHLDRVAVIYVDRDLRDVLVSSMRFVEQLVRSGVTYTDDMDITWCGTPDTPAKLISYLRGFGAGVADLIESISPWQALPEAFTLDFDRITKPTQIDEAIEHLGEIADFVGIERSEEQLREILKSRVGADTATWTGRLSNFREIWSDDVERVFDEIGFRRYVEP